MGEYRTKEITVKIEELKRIVDIYTKSSNKRLSRVVNAAAEVYNSLLEYRRKDTLLTLLESAAASGKQAIPFANQFIMDYAGIFNQSEDVFPPLFGKYIINGNTRVPIGSIRYPSHYRRPSKGHELRLIFANLGNVENIANLFYVAAQIVIDTEV